MTELEKIEYAKTFIDKLANGINPLDDTSIPENDIANNEDVLKSYVELLQNAIRDLRKCYADLINRIENSLITALNLKSSEYSEYKQELEKRFSLVKTYLLTDRQKPILNRILSKSPDKKTWYQSLAYVILDKQLENMLNLLLAVVQFFLKYLLIMI